MPDTPVHNLRVLTKWWADHYFRCSDDPIHGGPVGLEIKRGKRYTDVAFTDEELSNYFDDTSYYAYMFKSGEWRRDDDPDMYLLGEAAVRSIAYMRRVYPELAAKFEVTR